MNTTKNPLFESRQRRFVQHNLLRLGVSLCALLIVFLRVDTSAFCADKPAIDVAVSTEEIFVGETIDYQVEIKNVENPPAPDVSALKEQFDVVASGDQSRNQSSTFIINGRVSTKSELSHIYLYRLTPKNIGNIIIPPVKATINGTELTSSSISLRVQDAEEQDLVVVEIKSDRTTVYPTQPFTVKVKILVQPLPDRGGEPLKPVKRQPPHLQLNWVDVPTGLNAAETSQWLQPMLSDDGTGFTLNEISASSGSFFGGSRAAVFDLSKGRETRNGLDGDPIEYFVYELSRTFTPETTGSFPLGPSTVKGTFVAGVQGKEYTARRLVAIAPAVTVEVREVPSSRPATYTGGIGDYKVTASASPAKLRVGDPLTLTLEFERSKDAGSLELLSAPDLAAIPEVIEGFEIIDRAPTGRVEGNIKKFAYALRPKLAGVSIPALKFSSFDPVTEKFAEVSTDGLGLSVTEASKLSSGELVGSILSTPTEGIQKSAAGIFQNITDLSELQDERVDLNAWLMTIAGSWLFAGCLIAGTKVYRRKSSDTSGQRRAQARRVALSKLKEANQLAASGAQQDARRLIRAAFVGFVADMKDRITEGLTKSDIERALMEAAVPDEQRSSAIKLLESIEGAEYGAGTAIDAAEASKSAALLIEQIGPILQRSAHR